MDIEGNLIDVNSGGLALIEAVDFESVKKISYFELVDDLSRQKFSDFNRKICLGAKQSLVFELIGLKGSRKWIESYSAPYRLSTGEMASISITNDITEKVRAEEKYKKQEAASHRQAKLASIGELAAGVGHEVNNPLAIIMGIVSLVSKSIEKQRPIDFNFNELKTQLQRIQFASERIAKIVKSLRALSRVDPLNTDFFSVLRSVEESFNLIHQIYEKDGIQIAFSNDVGPVNDTVYGSQGHLQQVILNLISNARDAVSQKEEKIIKLGVSVVNGFVQISVTDNGTGIPDSLYDRIFDPFFTTKDVSQGTGLGLSLSYNFVKEMNGTIHFETEVGRGTTFYVRIPQAKGGLDSAELPIGINYPIVHGLNAIIVDDEPEILYILKSLLAEFGIKAAVADNGKTAYDLFCTRPSEFDMIISDIKMPVMDGPTLLNRIRSNREVVQPAFIFLTGGITDEFDAKEFPLIDGYLLKPINELELRKIISELKSRKSKNA
jgi:signal transduction histidine kinase/CheY-like chemotaxis protein